MNGITDKGVKVVQSWSKDWCRFARDAFGVRLDSEQEAILYSVQCNSRTSVTSGTARGKDFVAAVASLCFLYLTPKWNAKGELVENTKVAMTAPTDRQVKNIMVPEITRLYNNARSRGLLLPGRLVSYDIRTEYDEWFLTGFKASEYNQEAWSGFHAVNTMFVVTEATGISDGTFAAIEGNMQGNSRMLIVFNPNISIGYAAKSQKEERWHKFRLNSLTAPNVVEKEVVIPGQVDYEWVRDKVNTWCTPIADTDFKDEMDDFKFEGGYYRPEDLFRIKVLGKFPKVSEDALIPVQWVELANKRWHKIQNKDTIYSNPLRLGVDIAGMGRDSSCFCFRYGFYVSKFALMQSGGKADHMAVAGKVATAIGKLENRNFMNAETIQQLEKKAYIDTIGEGAGVYSRLIELGYNNAISCKYSESADGLKDVTGEYTFANMRAYLFWSVRDWLNPANNTGAAIPLSDLFLQEASEIRWKFQSNGSIIIEPKEEIKARLGRSPDLFDALANTFYPDRNREFKNINTVLNAFKT
jgi:hypothetical protein